MCVYKSKVYTNKSFVRVFRAETILSTCGVFLTKTAFLIKMFDSLGTSKLVSLRYCL